MITAKRILVPLDRSPGARGQPLFPFDLGAYRGEPICFLAGNPLGHQAAVVECRDALAVSGAARH